MSRRAIAWCAYGALVAAGMPNDQENWINNPVVLRLETAIGGETIAAFNDAQGTVVPILVAFDRAIAAGNTVVAGGR